jgi:hypothetical protein
MKYAIVVILGLVLFLGACTCVPPTPGNFTNYNLSVPYEESEFNVCGMNQYINNISTKELPTIPYWYYYTYDNKSDEFNFDIKHEENATFVITKICPNEPIQYFQKMEVGNCACVCD